MNLARLIWLKKMLSNHQHKIKHDLPTWPPTRTIPVSDTTTSFVIFVGRNWVKTTINSRKMRVKIGETKLAQRNMIRKWNHRILEILRALAVGNQSTLSHSKKTLLPAIHQTQLLKEVVNKFTPKSKCTLRLSMLKALPNFTSLEKSLAKVHMARSEKLSIANTVTYVLSK